MKEKIWYVRDKHGIPYGVLVSQYDGSSTRIGWSLCRKGDRFNKKYGVALAKTRLTPNQLNNVPQSIQLKFFEFVEYLDTLKREDEKMNTYKYIYKCKNCLAVEIIDDVIDCTEKYHICELQEGENQHFGVFEFVGLELS